jgi:hypothetical protein
MSDSGDREILKDTGGKEREMERQIRQTLKDKGSDSINLEKDGERE